MEERFGGGTGDAGTVGERLLVLAPDLGIRDACVDHGHIRAAVFEDRHDRLNACTAFSELGTDRMSKSVRADGLSTIGANESEFHADVAQRFVE